MLWSLILEDVPTKIQDTLIIVAGVTFANFFARQIEEMAFSMLSERTPEDIYREHDEKVKADPENLSIDEATNEKLQELTHWIDRMIDLLPQVQRLAGRPESATRVFRLTLLLCSKSFPFETIRDLIRDSPRSFYSYHYDDHDEQLATLDEALLDSGLAVWKQTQETVLDIRRAVETIRSGKSVLKSGGIHTF